MLRRTVRSIGASFATIVLLALIPQGSSAQSRSRGGSSGEPDFWIGLSIAYVDGMNMTDNASGASWQFGYSSQIRASLEKRLQEGVNLGIAAGYGTAPLTYTSGSTFNDACSFSCQAKGDITQYVAYLTGSGGLGGLLGGGGGRGGTGLRATYDVEGGFTQFSKFREETTNVSLPPTDVSSDFTFGLGGGVAYLFSPVTQLFVVAGFDYILHKQVSTTTASAPRVTYFRGGLKVGF